MEKVFLKNVHTGVIKTLEEWRESAVRFFTHQYYIDDQLQEDFETVDDYLKWADERGYFYADLVECDEDGNEIEE